MNSLAWRQVLHSYRVRVNLLLIVPMAVAAATQRIEGRHTVELKVMVLAVFVCGVGPAIVGSVAVNLAGGLGSGAVRLALSPNGIQQYLRSAMWVCTLCGVAVTIAYACCVLIIGVPLTTAQWGELLATGVAGNVAFMQLGLITSVQTPKAVDPRSMNGWSMYSFAGGALTVGYMGLVVLYTYLVAYHPLSRTVLLAAGGAIAWLLAAAAYFATNGHLTKIGPSQEGFLETLGSLSI